MVNSSWCNRAIAASVAPVGDERPCKKKEKEKKKSSEYEWWVQLEQEGNFSQSQVDQLVGKIRCQVGTPQ